MNQNLGDKDDDYAHTKPLLSKKLSSISVTHDFLISRLLQQHGVSANNSQLLANDRSVIASFMKNAALGQGADSVSDSDTEPTADQEMVE